MQYLYGALASSTKIEKKGNLLDWETLTQDFTVYQHSEYKSGNMILEEIMKGKDWSNHPM
jgi:hypothetical protein